MGAVRGLLSRGKYPGAYVRGRQMSYLFGVVRDPFCIAMPNFVKIVPSLRYRYFLWFSRWRRPILDVWNSNCLTVGTYKLWFWTRSFQYASPRLWNQLPAPLRQPRTNLSNSASPSCMSGTSSIGSIDSPLSSSITPSLFHSRLKIFLYCKSFPP